MLIGELKALLADMPDYYHVDVFSVELGNGQVIIQGDGFRSDDTEEVECPKCGHDVEARIVYRLEPRPKVLPLTQAQEDEAVGKLRELDKHLREVMTAAVALNNIQREISKAWRPE